MTSPLPPIALHLTALNVEEVQVDEALKLLSDEERKRADRLKIEKKRRQFIIGRAFLRRTLAGVCGCTPEELTFCYGDDGKPALTPPFASVSFNASHSGEWYLLAVSRDLVLGIDIEKERSNLDYVRVAERFFSPAEREQLAGFPESDRQLAFFRGWTRKEAYLKALGSGLRFPLDQFVVDLGPSARLLANMRVAGEPERWQMQEIDVPDGYRGALVYEGARRTSVPQP